MSARYLIRLPDPAQARTGGAYGFTAHGADAFAAQLQAALQGDGLFERWRQAQDDPDTVDPGLGATDANAQVTGAQRDLAIDLDARTSLPGTVLKHRLRLLAGSAWELRDVRG